MSVRHSRLSDGVDLRSITFQLTMLALTAFMAGALGALLFWTANQVGCRIASAGDPAAVRYDLFHGCERLDPYLGWVPAKPAGDR